MRRLVGVVLLLAALPAKAEDFYPETNYFTGIYQRVGRSAGDAPGLVNDLVRIDPAAEGWGLELRGCTTPDAAPLDLRRDTIGEVLNVLVAKEGQSWLVCQFFNDAGNYPILNCESETGTRFTLWALSEASPSDCPAP